MIARLRALFQDLADHMNDPDTTVLDETWEIAKEKMSRMESIFEQVIDATPDGQKVATSMLRFGSGEFYSRQRSTAIRLDPHPSICRY
jgi:hypothetical protein